MLRPAGASPDRETTIVEPAASGLPPDDAGLDYAGVKDSANSMVPLSSALMTLVLGGAIL